MRPLSQKRSERGAALLESALVFTVLFMMFLGTFDFARVMYYHQTLAERARAAARYAAIHPTDTAGIRNVAVYNKPAATGSSSPVLHGMTREMVNVANPDVNTPSARVIVTISDYPMEFVTPLLARAITCKPISAVMAAETQVP